MGGMTIRDLREAKGKRKIAYVQVAREEEAIAAAVEERETEEEGEEVGMTEWD